MAPIARNSRNGKFCLFSFTRMLYVAESLDNVFDKTLINKEFFF